ncbi:MAG TPA: hypothetical protein VFT72_01225 [Opitutaceae bacterium]|nr:hypothetical protein [Opitutaceae bacterium]
MGPGNGAQAVARGLQDVSGVAQQFAERKQNAVNVAATADAEMQIERLFDDHQIAMSRTTDGDDGTPAEERWLPDWQKKADKLKSSLLTDSGVSPAVREKLEVSLSHMIAESSSRIATQANVRGIQRQRAKLTNVANFLYERGSAERGDIVIDQMSEHGLIWPEEANAFKQRGREQADISNATKAIASDPIQAADQLDEKSADGAWTNFQNLDETTRLSLSRRARTETEALRAETVRTFQDTINQGGIVRLEDLQGAVDAKRMTPQQMRWLSAQQTGRSNYAESVVRMVDLGRRIDAWRPGDSDSDADLHKIAADMAGLPREMQVRLETDLRKISAPTVQSKSRPVDGYRYIDDLLRGGFFGATHGDVNEEKKGFFGTTTTKRKVSLEEAQTAYGKAIQLRDALKSFYDEKSNASAEEQKNFINGMIQGQVDLAAATPVLNNISGRALPLPDWYRAPKVTTREAWTALPAGAHYTASDGKTYIKRGNPQAAEAFGELLRMEDEILHTDAGRQMPMWQVERVAELEVKMKRAEEEANRNALRRSFAEQNIRAPKPRPSKRN